VTLEAEEPDDVLRGAVQLDGDFGHILIYAAKLAKAFGPLDLSIGGKTARIEPNDTAMRIAAALR
jgi:hypothetical protein